MTILLFTLHILIVMHKVDVKVNGQLAPFNMKIGDAGEAFFVFETDDDIPDDLVTSPILSPVQSSMELETNGLENPNNLNNISAQRPTLGRVKVSENIVRDFINTFDF